MKYLNRFFAALFAVGMAMGCSSDDVENGGVDNNDVRPGDKVYMSVSVTLPTGGGTRSETDDPNGGGSSSSNTGEETGKDYENKVSRMLIVLARSTDNGYITCGMVDTGLEMSQATVKATSELSKTELAAFYNNAALADQNVNLFVICNYTDDLKTAFLGENGNGGFQLGDKTWIDKVCEVTETISGAGNKNTTIWGKNNMLMTNAVIAKKMLPRTLKEWDAYSSKSVPLDLSINSSTSTGDVLNNNGAVRVERSVARFDFRDGSGNTENPNTYHVVATKLTPDAAEPVDIVDVRLNRIALANMSNKFYYFRRVTDAGTIPGGVCLPERPWGEGVTGNYVIDVDYATKTPGPTYYNFPLFKVGTESSDKGVIDETAREQWYTSLIDDVLKEGQENDEFGEKKYKIWRYVTENTVDKTSRMTSGLSTGIIFKGKMVPTQAALESTDEDIAELAKVLAYDTSDASLGLGKNTSTDPFLYTFGGNLYLRWPNIKKAALEAATLEDGTIVQTNSFYEAVFGKGDAEGDGQDKTSPNFLWNKWNDGNKQDADDLQAFKQAATKNGIAIYQSSEDGEDDWGYYCYYFYWNRHNDNSNSSIMDEMEFAVVRNNVYKLAVTNISRLGHPRLSENDPDPVNPEDPDETGKVYISVSVEVLPWVVRENNIEF